MLVCSRLKINMEVVINDIERYVYATKLSTKNNVVQNTFVHIKFDIPNF